MHTVDTPNFNLDSTLNVNKDGLEENSWMGPRDGDKSFSAELQFKLHSSSDSHCMLLTARSDSVRFGGWNLQVVGGQLSLQIGDGSRWLGVRAGPVEPNKWYHVAWQISNSSKAVEVYQNSVKYSVVHSGNSQWDLLPNGYRYATNNLTIGALVLSHPGFRFAGEIKNIKLGSGLVANTNSEFVEFSDTPVDISNIDVATYINLMDQYIQDRDWIQQALTRLRKELQEEMSLNTKLKELSTDNASFLVTRVEDFMNQYRQEITDSETELLSIFNELSRLIQENKGYMNNNKAVKDRLAQLNVDAVDTKIENIRRLIDSNVDLLKENNRWGDSQDKTWKFVQ